MPMELVFQNGRVMTPEEAKYPEEFRSVLAGRTTCRSFLGSASYLIPLSCRQANGANNVSPPFRIARLPISRVPDPPSPNSESRLSYLRALGVKTVLMIPSDFPQPVNRLVVLPFYRGARFSSGGTRNRASISNPSQLGNSAHTIGESGSDNLPFLRNATTGGRDS